MKGAWKEKYQSLAVGWVLSVVFSPEVDRILVGSAGDGRFWGVLTGEGRAELVTAGGMGRDAFRRCSVLIGNFVRQVEQTGTG